jgi:hypothetical protein
LTNAQASSDAHNAYQKDECFLNSQDLQPTQVDAVGLFLKRNDVSEESKRKLLVDNTARFYGLTK